MEKSLSERDRAVIWHPYTQMQTAALPIEIVSGEGSRLYTTDGTVLIDAVSSWWVTLHGHSHPYIAEKVSAQLNTLEHVIFAGFTHPSAVTLAERLLKILPEGQSKVFYSDNGSTAVEVALKMCLQFWYNQGKPKHKVIAFENSYHGDTFGAMAVSARSAFTGPFEKLLFDVIYLPLPNAENLEDLKQRLTDSMDEAACFIYEPLIQGAGGMLMYEAAHLNELVKHCREIGLLTIADEVMTGFGRSGTLFASLQITSKPDLVCLSKGLTGGTMPLGVTTCREEIYNAFLSEDRYKTLFHGHSFTANPVACAASLASLDLLEDPEAMRNIKRIEKAHQEFKNRIEKHPKVKNPRITGTIIAFDWETGSETSYFNSLRNTLYNYFLAEGILLRPLGNILYILPPLCITDDELAYIYNKIEHALERF